MQADAFIVRAKEPWTATAKNELSLKKDDMVVVTTIDPQRGYYTGYLKATPAKSGQFPSSVVIKENPMDDGKTAKTKEEKKILEQEKKAQEQKAKEAKIREKEEAKAREREAKEREKAEAKRRKDEEREQKLREKEAKRREKEEKNQLAHSRGDSKARRLSRRVTKYKIQTGANSKPTIVKGPVFGIPLGQLMYTSYTDFELPHIFVQAINFLQDHMKTEGLFRLSGSLAEINAWRTALDSGQSVVFEPTANPHSVAGLLKLFLRLLPEPLFTFTGYDECEMIATIPAANVNDRLNAIAALLKQLPPTNKLLIVELIRFLGSLSVFREVNKMGPANIGLVFGPNVIRRHKEDIDIRVPCEIVKFMVEQHEKIVSLGGAKIQNTEEVVEHIVSVFLPVDQSDASAPAAPDPESVIVDNKNFGDEGDDEEDTGSSVSTIGSQLPPLPAVHLLPAPPPPPPED